MGEQEVSNTMNLDLNLGPDPALVPYLVDRETEPLLRFRTRNHRSRFRQVNNILRILEESHGSPIEPSQLMIGSAYVPAGEGSIAGGERASEEEESKKCEHGSKLMEEDIVTEEKRVVEKSPGSDGSFFDCYICLDISKDPVVTNCGHLYCWSCLYRWLQVSEAKECPVCKGEISVKTLTPIYGRGKCEKEISDTKIPKRPRARRIESLRTSLHRSSYAPNEMMRHVHDRLERESSNGGGDIRARPFLNRFMTSRGVRAEQNQSNAALSLFDSNNHNDVVHNLPNIVPEEDDDLREIRVARERASRIRERLMRVGNQEQSNIDSIDVEDRDTDQILPTTIEESIERASRIRERLMRGRNQEQNNIGSVDVGDRDSLSSIVGVINWESELDPMLTVSTSSSVRRPQHENNGSRVSDVDSADSRPLRRRRLG